MEAEFMMVSYECKNDHWPDHDIYILIRKEDDSSSRLETCSPNSPDISQVKMLGKPKINQKDLKTIVTLGSRFLMHRHLWLTSPGLRGFYFPNSASSAVNCPGEMLTDVAVILIR